MHPPDRVLTNLEGCKKETGGLLLNSITKLS
jgi:hypothetical protein